MWFKDTPPEWYPSLLKAREARAYHYLSPYPVFGGFKHWQESKHGPLPRCRPFVRDIVQRQAMWLMGRPVTFRSDSGEFEKFINEAWAKNHMPRRMLELAEVGGHAGTVAVKFTIDTTKEPIIRFSCLHGVEHCQFFTDPLDSTRVIRVRVQFPYIEGGKWFIYREEITDDYIQIYEPKAVPDQYCKDPAEQWYPTAIADLLSTPWTPKGPLQKNPMGVINVVGIQHVSAMGVLGEGDLWRLWPSIDQYNFTQNLAHVDNQLSVKPRRVYLDVAPEDGDEIGSNTPDSTDVLKSTEGKQGKVELLETQGHTRPHIESFAEDLLQQIYDGCGAVIVRPDSITNKGNLTRGVLMQMYARLIESTNLKRANYGDAGLCVLFERIAEAMKNMGIRGKGAETATDVQIDWPDYFETTPEEGTQLVSRLVTEVENGLLPPETAQRKVLQLEGVRDVDEALKLLKGAATPNSEEQNDDSGMDRSKSK